ncbi:hypothetical protein LguiA_007912 [Lonicera macranthoides]
MVAQKDEYIKEVSKDYPEDTPLKDIIEENVRLNIVRDVLGAKRRQEFHGIGVGQVCEFRKGSSLRTRQLEEQLAAERVAREETQQRLDHFMQSWEQTMHQLVQIVPGFVPSPLIIPPQSNYDHVDEEDNDTSS